MARVFRFLITVLAFTGAVFGLGQGVPIRSGDILRIFAATTQAVVTKEDQQDPYSGEFTVQSDGAIYGVGFVRLPVAGHTVEEAQHLLRVAMRRLVKPQDLFLTLKSQAVQRVFIVGEPGVSTSAGSVPIVGRLGLRQALAGVVPSKDADMLDARIFRGGRQILKVNVAELLTGSAASGNLAMAPDDVISITSVPTVRVWVAGSVKTPGRISLPEQATIDQAIAEAGGPLLPATPDSLATRSEYRVLLRRGAEISEYPLEGDRGLLPVPVEAGDTITVEAPVRNRIVVAGEVKNPGEIISKTGIPLIAALAQSGGITLEGSPSDVLVYRHGEALVVNALPESSTQTATQFQLQDGDIVVVRKNEKIVYVFGEVLHQGKVPVPAEKVFRATDALSLAGGLSQNSTLRRVFLARPGPDGRMVISQFNLDEYIKDGKQSANPVLKPGDVLLFGQPRQTFLAGASQVLGSLLFLNTIAGSSGIKTTIP